MCETGFSFLFAVTLCVVHATFVEDNFKKLKESHIITGRAESESTTESLTECCLRCSLDDDFKWYQFLSSGQSRNCLLIHGNSTAESGQTFESNQNSIIYQRDRPATAGAVVTNLIRYWSFDNNDTIELHNGAVIVDAGKVNGAVYADGVDDWLDLGFVTDACITRPDTCGPEGAALAMWMNAELGQANHAGLLSAFSSSKTGFSVQYMDDQIRWVAKFTPQSGWYHVVLNYIGPNNGEGIQVYIDGAEVVIDLDWRNSFNADTAGDGKVVIGRCYVDSDENYGEVKVDELMIFNYTLSQQQILDLYNSYQ